MENAKGYKRGDTMPLAEWPMAIAEFGGIYCYKDNDLDGSCEGDIDWYPSPVHQDRVMGQFMDAVVKHASECHGITVVK